MRYVLPRGRGPAPLIMTAVAVLVVAGLLGVGYLFHVTGQTERVGLRGIRAQVAAAAPDGTSTSIGTAFVTDDAAVANPALAPAQLLVPPGFPQVDQTVKLPPGFSISLLAAGLRTPRFMTVDDDGNLLVAAMRAGAVYRFPVNGDRSYAPSATPPDPLLSQLNAPSSLALHNGYLYVGETDKVTRYRYDPRGDVSGREVVVPNLPTGGHSTRTVAFGPDGMLYVSIGSSCNICEEADQRRAAILRYTADGADGERYAWGLRNAVGLAFHPTTGQLWATVNERDNQGNEIPPDLVTIVGPGQDFGWPECQPPNAQPQWSGASCEGITPPTVGIQAHSAPLGLAFAAGTSFPDEYRGDLIVVQHGSWNRQPPSAPKLLRIHFDGDRPVSAEDFATGWQGADYRRWGRPAGIIVAPDGSLIVSDDDSGYLYRIAYTG